MKYLKINNINKYFQMKYIKINIIKYIDIKIIKLLIDLMIMDEVNNFKMHLKYYKMN